MNKRFLFLAIFIIIAGVALFVLRVPVTNDNSPETIKGTVFDNKEGQNEESRGGILIVKEGDEDGEEAESGDIVEVHYTGWLENGTKFDSSRDRGIPFSFILGEGQVIKGWDLGIEGMKIGEVRRLTIPPEFAYGNNAVGDIIPAGATLIFEVELLSITPGDLGDN